MRHGEASLPDLVEQPFDGGVQLRLGFIRAGGDLLADRVDPILADVRADRETCSIKRAASEMFTSSRIPAGLRPSCSLRRRAPCGAPMA